ncbi:chitinase, partial [Streptomyces daliensis]|nr:chitinase [Streptomyces daliensis]
MLRSDRQLFSAASTGRPRVPRGGLITFLGVLCVAALITTLLTANGSTSDRQSATAAADTPADGKKTVGYFTNWSAYQRNYH